MEDPGSVEITDTGWHPRDRIGETLQELFREIGRVYAPFLIANARALTSQAREVRTEIDGREWVQQPFPYQGKCLKWLRESHAALSNSDRSFVDQVLSATGCESIFTATI
jgi:phosphoglycolate phosphatase-like HAD superfamily hydrolase